MYVKLPTQFEEMQLKLINISETVALLNEIDNQAVLFHAKK